MRPDGGALAGLVPELAAEARLGCWAGWVLAAEVAALKWGQAAQQHLPRKRERLVCWQGELHAQQEPLGCRVSGLPAVQSAAAQQPGAALPAAACCDLMLLCLLRRWFPQKPNAPGYRHCDQLPGEHQSQLQLLLRPDQCAASAAAQSLKLTWRRRAHSGTLACGGAAATTTTCCQAALEQRLCRPRLSCFLMKLQMRPWSGRHGKGQPWCRLRQSAAAGAACLPAAVAGGAAAPAAGPGAAAC